MSVYCTSCCCRCCGSCSAMTIGMRQWSVGCQPMLGRGERDCEATLEGCTARVRFQRSRRCEALEGKRCCPVCTVRELLRFLLLLPFLPRFLHCLFSSRLLLN